MSESSISIQMKQIDKNLENGVITEKEAEEAREDLIAFSHGDEVLVPSQG